MDSFVTEHCKHIIDYVCKNKYKEAYYHYSLIKNDFENDYESVKNIVGSKMSAFFLPYYAIIASIQVGKYKECIRMYEIIFKQRFFEVNVFYINCLLYNSHCIMNKIIDKRFFGRFTDYIHFLKEKNVPLDENALKDVYANIQKYNVQKEGNWVFYCTKHFETKMIQQYIDNLNYIYPEHNIHLTNDKNKILTENPSKITFVYEVFDNKILNELPNTQFSFLNTEPLNIAIRLQHTINILKLYPNFEYYDYSESNLKILEENKINITNKRYLPYNCSNDEVKKLTDLNKNIKKEYDFGILKTLFGDVPNRRKNIIDFLKENNFTVNIIEGWGDDRDLELAKCKIILNVHGNLNTTSSNIFEHIRCDRLLQSGFNILSEDSYSLSNIFIEKYPNLKLISYDTFFNIEQIIECYNNKLSTKSHNKYVLNILKNVHRTHGIPQPHINFLKELKEHLNIDNMIIYDIGSSVLHWTEHASKIWNNSKIYIFDGMTEMKLFYDEYNKQNNTNYKYNVGVLCDKDYKRIRFYQNDELSGGNSYYKEIGHSDSSKIFTEDHIKHKIGMKLETVVQNKNIPMPDLIKIDVQGAELDILKGSMSIIDKAKFLIVELQHTQYNQGAPLCDQTRDFLIEHGWQVYAEKFSNNGPDADWCFVNTKHKIENLYKNNITPKLNKIIIFGFPHSGTSILKTIIGNCDNVVIENIIETDKIVNVVNNKFNLCKVAFADEKYFQEEYNDYIKIFIIRNPVFIFSSLNRRLGPYGGADKYHKIENYFKIVKLYDSVNYDNVYKIKYEEMFDNNYKKLKYILDNINIQYNDDIFKNNNNNNKFDKYLEYNKDDKEFKEKSFSHLRTWQINQPFANMNDISNINLTELQKNKLLNNKLVLKLFPDVCKILNTEYKPKIIDCFIFYNELELLTYRLNILNDFVDFFVLVESTHTFVGKEKQLFYLENKHMFEKFNDKIIHIVVDDFPHKFPNINIETAQQWNNEKFQRNCISRGLNKLSLQNNDVITITDLDEIPNPKIFQQIKNNEILVDQNILELDFYYFNLESRMDHQWRLSKIISYKNYKELGLSCEQIRQNMSFQIIKNSGWHLSYFGDEKFIKNKLQNFSHQELNNDSFATEEKIKERMDNKIDNYGNKIIDIKIEDNNNLPPDYDTYLTKFYNYSIQNIKSALIEYSNLRDDTIKFKNYNDYINCQTKTGLSFEKDNYIWANGQAICVQTHFNSMDRNSKILDICCGDGQGLKKFREMGFKNVYGVEVSKDKINFAKQYGYTIYNCDICSGPFDIGDNYDCIYSSHTIEHVLNPEYTISNIMSRLKEGGEFILILPYPDVKAANPSIYEHRFKVHCGSIPLGLHINDNGSTLINKIQQMGYTVTDHFVASYREPEIHLTIIKQRTNKKTLVEKNLDDFKYESYPYEHIIIDDFLKKDVAEKALNEINNLSDESACGWFNNKTKWEWNKGYWENLDTIPIQIKEIFTELLSQEFINKLEKLTGIKGLIAGKIFRGTSIHRINNGGYLGLHTDFNSYNMEGVGKLDRRINLLIYMNKDWKLEYGGQFDLCDLETKKCIKRINPDFNRCTIFNTSSKSIHGHPEPLNLPEGMRRQSIAIYYYSKNQNGDKDFEGDKVHSTLFHDAKDFDYTKAKIV